MAQFDVYINNGKNKKQIPFILDIQNDILSHLHTRVIIPLAINKPYEKNIHPEFNINKLNVIMMTTQLTGVPKDFLGKRVCSLEEKRTEIINAIDFLITGY